MKNIYIYLLVTFVFSSCATFKTSFYQVKKPSTIELGDHISSIQLVNHTLYPWNETVRTSPFLYNEDQRNILNQKGMMHCVLSLKSELVHSPKNINTKIGITDWPRDEIDTLFGPVKQEDIELILKTSDADVLIVLDDFWMSGKSIYYKKGNKDPLYQINTSALWRIYDTRNQVYIDEFAQQDSLRWPLAIYDPKYSDEKLAAYEKASIQNGENYAHYIFPSWLWIKRHYFHTGNAVLKEGARYFQTKQYEKAFNTWFKLTESEDSEIKAKACYNLALIKELNGELPAAMEWLNQADKSVKDDFLLQMITDYKISLKKRLKSRLKYMTLNH